jgi:hypothetical protein
MLAINYMPTYHEDWLDDVESDLKADCKMHFRFWNIIGTIGIATTQDDCVCFIIKLIPYCFVLVIKDIPLIFWHIYADLLLLFIGFLLCLSAALANNKLTRASISDASSVSL